MGRLLQIPPIAEDELAADFRRFGQKLALTNYAGSAYASERVMSQSLYRYYYYYGPLSSGRDGSAMGCRRAMQT